MTTPKRTEAGSGPMPPEERAHPATFEEAVPFVPRERAPIAGAEWRAPTAEEMRADLLALLRYAHRHGGLDALDRPGAVAEALREAGR